MRTVALCEIEAFAIANLVAKMEAGLMDPAPIWTDLKTFPWAEFRDRVDILTGGYPCQPFSSAGKRAGADDPRHLWPYIASGIRLLRPKLCFFENVEGHISLGLREVVGELEELGYKTTWGIFSAAECGAPHQRKRVFIMAHRIDQGPQGGVRGWQDSGREDQHGHARCGSAGVHGWWPSRPGQPQHAWEPPRVVGNASSSKRRANDIGSGGQEDKAASDVTAPSGIMGNARGNGWREDQQGRESKGRVAADGAGESMGNTSNNDGRHIQERSGALRPELTSWRETESALGLCADESSSVLGEALTLNPYGHSVNAYESLSEKARARQILFEVWSKANTQEVQWTHRGLQCFLAKEILWTGMQLAAFTQRICYFVWCVQTGHPIQGWGLSGMWVYESCRNPSQGQEPIEQFKRELGYAMCQLSYEIALERGQEAVEGAAILQGLREASEGAWVLSDALPEMEEVWRSTLDQKVWENGCYVEAASQGNRTDELRLLGNGVVQATAEKAFRTLFNELH